MGKKKKRILRNSEENPLQNKCLLIINTGWPRKKFILQHIKKLGVHTIMVHKEKNWAEGYVNDWIIADTYDHGETIEAIQKYVARNPKRQIDGVITFWEDDVLLTAKIADKLNLIGIPYRIARQARNKFLFRQFCKAQNLPFPQHRLIRNREDINFVKDNFQFPVVIKPAYGASGAFVMKVVEVDDLASSVAFVQKHISTTIESALSDGLDIFVEEYIDGDEVDVDLIIQNGKIKFHSVSDNFNKNRGAYFIDSGQSIPSGLPASNQEEIIDMVEEVLEKLGITNGCIHFEAKSSKQGVYPLEVNLRMGGDYIYSYVKGAWGVDLITYALYVVMGIYIKPLHKTKPLKHIVGWDLYPPHSGVLVQWDIDETLYKKPYIEDISIYKKIGDPVLVPPDGVDDYLGWLTVSGENRIDVQDNLSTALSLIRFRVVKFDAGSSIGKTERKSNGQVSYVKTEALARAAKIEKIKTISRREIRKLHIGISCNIYESNGENGESSEVEQDLMSVGKNIEKTLVARGYRVTFFDFNNLPKAFSQLRRSDVDMVFNVCERINDSSLLEPHAASVLDTLQIPYTGSNPFTLALCIDKIRVKKLLAYHDIPTPNWDYAYTMEDEIDEDLQYPLIVKPGNTDNSIGITNDSIVTNKKELEKQLSYVIETLKRPALVEEYIEGDEYDVSIIGSDEIDLQVLPLSQSIFNQMPKGYWHIYPFEAKWHEEKAYKKILVQRPPRGISKRLSSLISEIALDTYNILDCHDYGRVEIRVDVQGNPYVLELNPNPSININDCVPACAELANMDYGDFLETIIQMAIRRYKNKPPYFHLQTNLL